MGQQCIRADPDVPHAIKADLADWWSRRRSRFHDEEQAVFLLERLQQARRLADSALKDYGDERAGDWTLDLVEISQEIDSLLQLLTTNELPPMNISASGLDLGFSEHWLHWLLVLLEAEGATSYLEKHGPVPLISLLAHDLCGVHGARRSYLDPSDTASELPARLEERLRFVPISGDGSKGFGQAVQSGEIPPEFMLLGTESGQVKEGQHVSITWHMLIRTEVSEPFHTCRVKFSFDPVELARFGELFADSWEASATMSKKVMSMALKEFSLSRETEDSSGK